jgi:hypothetical protein
MFVEVLVMDAAYSRFLDFAGLPVFTGNPAALEMTGLDGNV